MSHSILMSAVIQNTHCGFATSPIQLNGSFVIDFHGRRPIGQLQINALDHMSCLADLTLDYNCLSSQTNCCQSAFICSNHHLAVTTGNCQLTAFDGGKAVSHRTRTMPTEEDKVRSLGEVKCFGFYYCYF